MFKVSGQSGLPRLYGMAAALLLTVGTGVAAQAPNVQATDGAGLKQALAGEKGKVVVLNLWATWCGPCVEEFPSLVKLHNSYSAKGLTVVAASLDEPDDQGKVVAFIEKQKAAFPVYVRRSGAPEKFIDPIDKGWTGAVPTTYIFDRNGKRVGKPIIGERSYEQLVTAVEPLLK
jgi:thiol-disulfide isomerase/thioredoxin